MSLPLVYIAGPFRGATPLDVRRNVEAARDVGLLVAQAGAYPIIPHTMTADFDKQLTDEFWLQGTLALLMRCDALFLLPSWVRSSGAKAELAAWQRLPEGTCPVFTVDDWDVLRRWAREWSGPRVAWPNVIAETEV